MPTPETPILDERAVSEIESRVNAATKAPWHQSALAGLYIVADGTDFATIASVGEYNADGSIHLLFTDAEANLEFIVHAREDIPVLCATVKHLRERLTQLQKWQGDVEEREAAVCPEDVGFDEYIRSLQSQLEQLRAELNAVRQQPTTPLLMKIVEIADLGSAQEFNDAPERLRSIRGLIVGENV